MVSDDTYDEYGVNTKNSFNTPPRMEWYRLWSIHVSLNVIGGVTISTVLLSKRYADDNDSYETCVFQPDGDSNVIGCYSTEEEAIAGHNRILKEQLTRV